jgi:hypothetical protein
MGLTANELSPFKGTGGSNPLASAVNMLLRAIILYQSENLTAISAGQCITPGNR